MKENEKGVLLELGAKFEGVFANPKGLPLPRNASSQDYTVEFQPFL